MVLLQFTDLQRKVQIYDHLNIQVKLKKLGARLRRLIAVAPSSNPFLSRTSVSLIYERKSLINWLHNSTYFSDEQFLTHADTMPGGGGNAPDYFCRQA